MMKGAYISFFNKNLRTSILKIHTIPGAYRKAAKMERYPKVCDRMAKFKETNDKAIQTHAKVWEKALEIASTFKQK